MIQKMSERIFQLVEEVNNKFLTQLQSLEEKL